MAAIRGKDTAPERIVRSVLHRLGCRFALHRADVPAEARSLIRQSAIRSAAAKDPRLNKRRLTNLYNERPTWLRLAHEALDRAALAAYAATDPDGQWPEDWAECWTDTGAGHCFTGKMPVPPPTPSPLAAPRSISASSPISCASISPVRLDSPPPDRNNQNTTLPNESQSVARDIDPPRCVLSGRLMRPTGFGACRVDDPTYASAHVRRPALRSRDGLGGRTGMAPGRRGLEQLCCRRRVPRPMIPESRVSDPPRSDS
jgi:hypothetical protein